MAKRYSDTGITIVRSEADDQVWLPKAGPDFEGELTVEDMTKCAGRLRAAREATEAALMDDEGGKWEFRWVKEGNGTSWKLQERETG